MMRSPCSYFLLLLVHLVLDRVNGSSIDRIQYRGASIEMKRANVLAHCTKRATNALFEPTNRIIVIANEADDSSTTNNYLKILSNDASSLTLVSSKTRNIEKILNPPSTLLNYERNPSYVIISNNLENLREIFSNKRKWSTWSEYLIVTKMDEDSLNIFGLALFNRGYIRVAFLHPEYNDSSVVLRRYDEISRFSITLDPPQLQKIAICRVSHENSTMNGFGDGIEPFSDILCPAKGCHLTVGHVSDDMVGSPEVAKIRRYFDCASHVINFFIQCKGISLKKRINYDENLNWTKTVEGIERDEIDFAYGSFVPANNEGTKNLHVATWFDFETITFLDVSRRTVVAPLTKIFVPLDAYVWLCLIILLVIYSLFAVAVKKAYREKIIDESMKIFDIWAILLGQGIHLPANMGLRAVFGMWTIAVLLINAAYGSAFSSSLASWEKINSLKTLRDLNKSNRLIAGTAVARELFNNSDDETDREIYAKWRLVKGDEVFQAVLKEHAVGVDYAINVKLHNVGVRTRKVQRPFYLLEEPVLVYPLQFYLKKNHPYLKPLRRLVVHARAAGLVHKWRVDDIKTVEAHWHAKYFRKFRVYRSRKIRDMSVSFKAWIAGILLSLLTFFYELYKSKYCCFHSRTKNGKTSKSSVNETKQTIIFSKKWKAIDAIGNKNISSGSILKKSFKKI